MKNRLHYIFVSALIITTTTSFGFLESSTIKQVQINRQIKFDSVKNASYNLHFSQPSSFIKKEGEKPENDQITKSTIQSVANLVKNIALMILNVILKAVIVIFKVVLMFFMAYFS